MVALAQVVDSLTARHHPRDSTERWLACLLGMSDVEARRIMVKAFVRSEEVAELVEEGEEILGGLPRRTVQRDAEMSVGLTGAVSWGATAAVSAQRQGADSTFVVRPIEHTRTGPVADLLMAALHDVARVGAQERRSGAMVDPVIRERSRLARRLVSAPENRSLDGARPNRRTRADARRVKHPSAALALRLDARRREPVSGGVLEPELDRLTRLQLRLLYLVLAAGHVNEPLVVDGAALVAGPVRFVHPRNHGARGEVRGIRVNGVLLDAPEPDQTREEAWSALRRRADGAPCRLVSDRDEVFAALAEITQRVSRRDEPAAAVSVRRSPSGAPVPGSTRSRGSAPTTESAQVREPTPLPGSAPLPATSG